MERNENPLTDGSYRGCLYYLITVVILIAISAFLLSCKTVYVPVETVRTEYVNRTDTFLRVDSFINNTNTIIREASKDDSLLLAEYGIKLKDNEKLLLLLRKELQRVTSEQQENHKDTFIKIDSIQVPYPVEKKLTKWQKIKMDAGGIAIIAMIFVVILVIINCLLKLNKVRDFFSLIKD